MITHRNIVREYDSAKQACLTQGGVIAAGVSIEFVNLKLLFDELEPTIPSVEEARISFLEDHYTACVKTMEQSKASGFECFISEEAINANYQTTTLQAEADFARFNQNVAPYEGLATAGLALAFGAAAVWGILKPTIEDYLEVRAEVREIKEFLGIL